MINQLKHLHWISILLAFAAYFLLGALWFTLFFGKYYKISLGRAHETLQTKPIFIIGPAACTLAITITSAMLINSLNIQTFNEAFKFSVFIGLGFLVANTINIAINPNIPKPILYGIISGCYHLVGMVMVSIIIVTMK